MHRARLIALIFIVPLVLACPKEEALPTHQGSASTPASSDPGTLTPIENAPATNTVAPTTAPAAGGGAAIARANGENTGVTLNVTELKRGSGGTLTLRFNIMNGSSDNLGFGYDYGDPTQGSTDYGAVGGVHLLDPVGKKKYFTVRDSDNKCVCSRDIATIKPGESKNLWVKFPAPPADVQRVTVVVPHFEPMDDVPIS